MSLLHLLADLSRDEKLRRQLFEDPHTTLERYDLDVRKLERHAKSYDALSRQLVKEIKATPGLRPRRGGIHLLIWGEVSKGVVIDSVEQAPDPQSRNKPFTLKISGEGFAKGMRALFATAQEVIEAPDECPEATSVTLSADNQNATIVGTLAKPGKYPLAIAVPQGDGTYTVNDYTAAVRIVK